MVEFKTLKAKEVKFGRNSFIEVSKRKVVTPVGENVFLPSHVVIIYLTKQKDGEHLLRCLVKRINVKKLQI
jgi:hypothetical protein